MVLNTFQKNVYLCILKTCLWVGKVFCKTIAINYMKKVLTVIALLFATVFTLSAQDIKRVAILETVDKFDKVDYGVEFQLRAFITDAVSHTPGYEGYDRVDMSQINREQNFQRTGMVSDADIKEIGKMTGASSIVVAEAAAYGSDDRIIIVAKIINIETGRIENTAKPKVASPSDNSMEKACNEVVSELLGNIRTTAGGGSYTQTRPVGGQSTGAATITITAGNVSFEMIKVEAGSFIMGCTNEQGSDCYDSENPSHRVTITQDYYIGKYEVTQELYEAVMGVNPSRWKAYNRPVEMVSWNDAQEFCAELSRMTGRRFTLPTEAEWEYAARGGKKNTNAKYSGSSSVNNVAWYDGNSGNQTHPVGTLRPNELGIYDMSGNVWEWCQDWYGSYSSTSQTDPAGPGSGSDRVLRGGSWGSGARGCRVAYRFNITPDYRSNYFGFRIVLH